MDRSEREDNRCGQPSFLTNLAPRGDGYPLIGGPVLRSVLAPVRSLPAKGGPDCSSIGAAQPSEAAIRRTPIGRTCLPQQSQQNESAWCAEPFPAASDGRCPPRLQASAATLVPSCSDHQRTERSVVPNVGPHPYHFQRNRVESPCEGQSPLPHAATRGEAPPAALHVPVAQLDRALASGARGCRFESCRGYSRCRDALRRKIANLSGLPHTDTGYFRRRGGCAG